VIKRTVPVLLAVVLLLAGVHWLNRRHDLETEGGDTLPPYPYAGAPWVEARVQGLRFALPKAFDASRACDGMVHAPGKEERTE